MVRNQNPVECISIRVEFGIRGICQLHPLVIVVGWVPHLLQDVALHLIQDLAVSRGEPMPLKGTRLLIVNRETYLHSIFGELELVSVAIVLLLLLVEEFPVHLRVEHEHLLPYQKFEFDLLI